MGLARATAGGGLIAAGARGAVFGVAAASAAVFVLLVTTVHGSRLGGFFSDAVTYLFMADFFSPWVADDALVRVYYRSSRFPPLFPALLGLAGGGSESLARANLVVAVTLAAAAPLAGALAWRMSRSVAVAVLAALAIGFAPLSLRLALEVLSEPLFLVLSLGALLSMALRDGRAPAAADLLPGLLVALAILSREIGVALLPALLIWTWRRRAPAAWIGFGIALALFTAWRLLRAAYPVGLDYDEATALALAELAEKGLLGVLGPTLANLFQAGWVDGFGFTGSGYTRAVAVVIALLALPALAAALLRLEPAAVYVAAYLGILSIWPYPNEASRFLGPLLPLVLIYACRAGAFALSAAGTPGVLALAAVPLLAGAALVLESGRVIARLALPLEPELAAVRAAADFFAAPDAAQARRYAEQRLRVILTAEAIAEAVPPSATVCSTMSSFATLRSRRTVADLLKPDEIDKPDDLGRWLRAHCSHLFVVPYHIYELETPPFYPLREVTVPLLPVLLSERDGDTPGAPRQLETALLRVGADGETGGLHWREGG